jgi:hypothetical protein
MLEVEMVKFLEMEQSLFWRNKTGEDTVMKLIRDKIILELKNNHRQTHLIKIANLCEEENRREKNSTIHLTNSLKEEIRKLEAKAYANRRFLKSVSNDWRNTPYPGVENYIRYSVARLELLELTGVKQLITDTGPVINDVLSFQYPISILQCNDSITSRSAFIAVISAPDNFKKRNVIRKTWKINLKRVNEDGLLPTAGFAFILGLTKSNVTQEKIEEEHSFYGDIIQIGIPDFYRNLSFKVAGLLNWLHRNCPKVDFVLKVDDDVYVNVRNLVHFVQSHHQDNQSVFGVGDPNGGVPDRGNFIYQPSY